jgi:hypothetical protein
LFVVGGDQYGSNTLIALDATTGTATLPKVTLPESMQAFSLAYRAANGGQLLVAAANDNTLALLVYRVGDLQLVGILPSGYSSVEDCGSNLLGGVCFMGVVTFYEPNKTAYVVAPGSPFPLWTFDLLTVP